MALRYRQMQPKDVATCVQIVASNPVLGPRYGVTISKLEPTWLHLLRSEAFTAVVFEESGPSSGRLIGAGISVFLSDAFVREMKTSPLIWIGPEIVRRLVVGNSPVLSDKQLAESNTQRGLNLFGWHGATSVEDGNRVEVLNTFFGSFIELHRGFLIKEVLGQADSVGMVSAMSNSGGGYFDPKLQRHVHSLPASPEEILSRPHLMGQTREMAIAGAWLSGSSLFSWQPPKFGFRRSEQRLLTSALQGGTDEDLSNQLNVSISSVRRTWLGIYDRVAAHAPEILGESLHPGNALPGRGKSKKHRLLAYLREHPEELRPISRKLLATTTHS
ncbi:MAG TPA: hypothetical protein VFA90_11190 [Terriglobales bacterium]|nr:hypothetical protein [Terriglobales bacterium]